MKRWVKLSESVNSDPTFRLLSRAARGVYAQLLLAADPETGCIEIPPGSDARETVAAVCWAMGDGEMACEVELGELQHRRVVVVDLEVGRLVIPSHPARGRTATVNGAGMHGVGARGGQTPAERQRAHRERVRAARAEGSPVTEPARDSTRDMSRAVTAPVTVDPVTVTESVTGFKAASTAENPGQTPPVTESCHGVTGARSEKIREDQKRSEETEEHLPTVGDASVREGAPAREGSATGSRPRRSGKRAPATPAIDPVPEPGILARRVFDAIVGDINLRPITAGPGELATRLVALCEGTDVDPAREVIALGGWLAANPGRWKDGRSGLLRNIGSKVEQAARVPRPAPGAATSASSSGSGPSTGRLDFNGHRVQGAAGLPPGKTWERTPEEWARAEDEAYARARRETQPRDERERRDG